LSILSFRRYVYIVRTRSGIIQKLEESEKNAIPNLLPKLWKSSSDQHGFHGYVWV